MKNGRAKAGSDMGPAGKAHQMESSTSRLAVSNKVQT